ncbi:MAG: N-acetylmuramoyl-L-alanine amidase [Lachnospiraceae bacterium]|nr:N-acetylmuramoyl-L-alanine amidase [Lachnospiraceae bacterium]
MKICIDAGHGGKDSGATNANLYEKDVNLDIAKKLNALCLLAGFETVMTRENDIYHSPSEKAEKANLSNADIFISIHCNSAASVLANGTETLVYSTGEGTTLGEAIQKALISRLELRDRGIKQRSDLIVLNSTKMPAVLVEVAFISNPSEKVLLANADFRQNAATAIFEGISSFFKKGVENVTTEEAILKLKEKGVLQNPEYWINASNCVLYLPELLKNMANTLV